MYNGEDVTNVCFGDYVRSLCADLLTSVPERSLRIDVEDEILPTDVAVPLGLILVEFVTNAVKHSDSPFGTVDIRFKKVANDEYELGVRDYGNGLPEDFSAEGKKNSLGMQIILGFVRQLGGTLRYGNVNPGAAWSVRFKLINQEPA